MKLKYFELAKKLSEKSDYRHRLGAVIVKKNRIAGFGVRILRRRYRTELSRTTSFVTTTSQ